LPGNRPSGLVCSIMGGEEKENKVGKTLTKCREEKLWVNVLKCKEEKKGKRHQRSYSIKTKGEGNCGIKHKWQIGESGKIATPEGKH